MCRHGLYAGVTVEGDEFVMDCPKCERLHEWAEEDTRDAADDAADARDWREDNNL